ncbi:3-phosphoinositide-dependent protein kinase [Acrasis kona]|uniref:non-specific serine/threonine protein kinase n=1 Tax=Acrasis kona TaxID=1008807 RepID=A0AAW2ZBM3_9EUKA
MVLRNFSKDDFTFKNEIGCGNMCHVMLAEHNDTKIDYAVKIINKAEILQRDVLHVVKTERAVLEKIDHKSIIKLEGTFQDPFNLYFVLEYAPKGELFDRIVDDGPLSIDSAKFYLAELVNALDYLKSKGILHRDVKPGSETLHIKLSDFNSAMFKPTESDSLSEEQKKVNGTVEFMSPESINRELASEAVDLWALGCTAYFLIDRGDSEYDTFNKILEREIEFPQDFDPNARDLIEKLLKIDPKERLGMSENGYLDIKTHPFFSGIDFDNIHDCTPPVMHNK